MKRKLEGLLISKIPFKERDLIGKILLRNGKCISVIFHGGRGGGTKKKSSVLELGFMMSIDLQWSRGGSDLYRAKEWNPIWTHQHIRNHTKAFYLLCFYCEVMGLISFEENLHDSDDDGELQGLFRVVSNALFYCEKELGQKSFDIHKHLLLFLSKLLLEQGVFPRMESCRVCGNFLNQFDTLSLISERGGFACERCQRGGRLGKELWTFMGQSTKTRYQEFEYQFDSLIPTETMTSALLHYFYFQFQLSAQTFKSLSLLI
ncbi:MAG: hypothetical protein ACO20H_09715 [Bacteriovoracaceae bacterium]